MLPRLLILCLLIPTCAPSVAAQSSPDKTSFSFWPPKNGLNPPQEFRLHIPALSQKAQAPQLQQPLPWDALNFSTSHSSLRNSAATPSRSHGTPLLVTQSGAIVSLAKAQSRTQQTLLAIPRANPPLNFARKPLWTCLRGRHSVFVPVTFCLFIATCKEIPLKKLR